MAVATDAQISGQGGAFAYQSLATGGTLRYAPFMRFVPNIRTGNQIIPAANNFGESANTMIGITTCGFTLMAPFSHTAFPADFFSKAFLSYSGDTSLYLTTPNTHHTFTVWPNIAPKTGTVKTYQLCKFNSWSMAASFVNGGAQVQPLQFTGLCCDPEHGTALAAPSSGAVNTDKIFTYANASYTGASSVVSVSVGMSTLLRAAEGSIAGSGSYPFLVPGCYQGGFDSQSTLTLTQYKTAGTVPSGTLVLKFGVVSAGIQFTYNFINLGNSQPVDIGSNLQQMTYGLVSPDGTTPAIQVADL